MSATKDGECEQRVRVRHGTDGHTDNDHHCIMPTPYGSGCIILTSCRREAATICPHPDLQVMTRHTSYTHLDPLLTRCPCWLASTANQSGLVTLTFDLLTLKVVSQSRVMWATSVPILVFLGLSVLDLGPMRAKRNTLEPVGGLV